MQCFTIPIKNHIINLYETVMLICMQKLNLVTYFFLKILQRNKILVILGLWACVVTHTQSDTENLQKTFEFICKQKINFIPHVFLEVRYANLLLWVLWTCLTVHTLNDNSNFQKTSMFICMPKINFIIHFVLETLNFKESCNLIGQQHFAL